MVFKKQTYSTVVADYIKRQIQQGELLPGQAIKEVALAEHLGISRAPVREALESLVQEGLVTSEPQKGKRVRLMSPEEIRTLGFEFAGVRVLYRTIANGYGLRQMLIYRRLMRLEQIPLISWKSCSMRRLMCLFFDSVRGRIADRLQKRGKQ